MNTYVVCMDEYRIRDAQMFDTNGLTDDELLKINPFSEDMENRWYNTEVIPYIGIFHAESEEAACEIAAKTHRYDVRVLYATKIETGGDSK